MTKYKVVSGFCLSGVGDVYPGAIISLNPRDAARELQIGRVVEYIEDVGAAADEAAVPNVSRSESNTTRKKEK